MPRSTLVTFQTKHPQIFTLIVACCLACVVFFDQIIGDQKIDVVYPLFAAALALLMSDVIETALIQRATVTTWKSIWFWIFAFYMGYFWAVFMIIGQWNGMDNPNAQILIYLIGGLGFGFLMSTSVKGDIYVNKDHYDLTRPINKIQMMWPFILFGLAVAHLIAGLVSHGDTLFIYNLVLFSGLSPLYVRPKGKGLLLGWTKLLGFLIIIGILLVKRLSYNS